MIDFNIDDYKGEGTILLVDDEKGVLDVTRAMLETFGFKVITAGGGGEALVVFQEWAPEIKAVLLDLSMPDMTGEDALTELRRVGPDVPVILVSGHDESRVKGLLQSSAHVGFLKKPYRLPVLIQTVKEAIEV